MQSYLMRGHAHSGDTFSVSDFKYSSNITSQRSTNYIAFIDIEAI